MKYLYRGLSICCVRSVHPHMFTEFILIYSHRHFVKRPHKENSRFLNQFFPRNILPRIKYDYSYKIYPHMNYHFVSNYHLQISVFIVVLGRLVIVSESRADSRLASSQWDTSLQNNAVSHRLGANRESALDRELHLMTSNPSTSPLVDIIQGHFRKSFVGCGWWLTHWVNSTIFGSDNGLSPGRRQAIICTKCRNIVNWPPGNKLQWNLNRNLCIFIQENALENVVRNMTAILSPPHCVESERYEPQLCNVISCVCYHLSIRIHSAHKCSQIISLWTI